MRGVVNLEQRQGKALQVDRCLERLYRNNLLEGLCRIEHTRCTVCLNDDVLGGNLEAVSLVLDGTVFPDDYVVHTLNL